MTPSSSPAPEGIDRQDAAAAGGAAPYNEASFAQIRILDAWAAYAGRLSWGRGQCLAILDDGCKLDEPAWQARLPWGPKVIATWNSIDGNPDANPVPPGYHGTTVGYPSSMNHNGIRGAAYNNQVAQVRCVTIVHLKGRGEAPTMAAGLRWVLDQAARLSITAVNLSPLDDERHTAPVPTEIDEPLRQLRERGIWVSAPCGNHHYTDGISWPACQPHCYAIGGAVPGRHEAHLDRFGNTDLLVCATATSSSNAYAAACSQILREAIAKTEYPWTRHGDNLADALMDLFQKTGVAVNDPATGCDFRELDLLAALNHVFA
jgi:hypothetical protein